MEGSSRFGFPAKKAAPLCPDPRLGALDGPICAGKSSVNQVKRLHPVSVIQRPDAARLDAGRVSWEGGGWD